MKNKILLIEKKLKERFVPFCIRKYWNVNYPMSAREISEEIFAKTNIVMSHSTICKLINKFSKLRSQKESLKTRAITGRMDYKKSTRKINYKRRDVNTAKAWQTRRNNLEPIKKQAVVILEKADALSLREFAKSSQLTISDALKLTYAKNKKDYKTLVLRIKK